MKESKRFFANNRLNRGYTKISHDSASDNSAIRKKYDHVLPPLEIMEQYEELHPGSIKLLFDMAKKEQSHRHSMDFFASEKQSKALFFGRICALIFIALLVISTLMLVMSGFIMVAIILILSAFFSITLISHFHFKSTNFKRPYSRESNFYSQSRPARHGKSNLLAKKHKT